MPRKPSTRAAEGAEPHPVRHAASVTPAPATRSQIGEGGKGYLAPRIASDGLLSALAATDTMIEALGDYQRLLAIAHNQIAERRKTLRTNVRPELERAIAAAERVVDLERERAIRRRKIRAITRGATVTRIAA